MNCCKMSFFTKLLDVFANINFNKHDLQKLLSYACNFIILYFRRNSMIAPVKIFQPLVGKTKADKFTSVRLSV